MIVSGSAAGASPSAFWSPSDALILARRGARLVLPEGSTNKTPSGDLIAGIALARDVLSQAAPDAGIVLAALLVHFMLSIAFGLILAVIMAPFSFDSSIGVASPAGAVFGLAVYVINFYGITTLVPWLADARGAPSFLAHVVFGLVAADAYLIGRREDRPSGLGSAG